jgi:quercetin 2,3-dioxygenase
MTNTETRPDPLVCSEGGLPGPLAMREGGAPVEIITAPTA